MQQETQADAQQSVDLDFRLALERVDSWVDGFIQLLPNLIAALVVLAIFWVIGIIVRRTIAAAARTRRRDNLGEVLGGFAKSAVIVIGGLLAITIVLPGVRVGDLVAGLGVGSVAIGFAFKDILQNWLAGMLLLLRQPFEIGDQIEVSGFTGTVERIETRATMIKTFDAQRVVIPNSDIYTSAVLVKTAFEVRRSEYDVGIGYGDDIAEACRVILKALDGLDGVEKDPAPQALSWDLAASWVTIRVRWWTDSTRADLVAVRSEVIREIKRAFDEARIDMPYETRVQLMHDQTEAEDGDRSAQREGWPLAGGENSTTPRWKAEREERAG